MTNPTQAKRQAISRTLEGILQEVIIQLELSEPSAWAELPPSGAVEILRDGIAMLQKGGRLSVPIELASLFAPTGDIQEIAMANDWHDKYHAMSSQFDDARIKYNLADCD